MRAFRLFLIRFFSAILLTDSAVVLSFIAYLVKKLIYFANVHKIIIRQTL